MVAIATVEGRNYSISLISLILKPQGPPYTEERKQSLNIKH